MKEFYVSVEIRMKVMADNEDAVKPLVAQAVAAMDELLGISVTGLNVIAITEE